MIALLVKIIMTVLFMAILAEISRNMEHTDLPDDVTSLTVKDIKFGAGNIFDLAVYAILCFNFICTIMK